MSFRGPRIVSMTCWPGSTVWASVEGLSPDRKALVLYLDPVSLAVSVPSFPGGDVATVTTTRLAPWFARELVRGWMAHLPTGSPADRGQQQ